jgi:hypothetical protein
LSSPGIQIFHELRKRAAEKFWNVQENPKPIINMSLMPCPECRKQISTSADVCPHCGFPNPQKNKNYVAPPSGAPPSMVKEDVSAQFPMISIDATDAIGAVRQIIPHLNRLRAEGWTTGNAYVTNQGTAEYIIENATKKATLRFDMRPTLKRGVSPLSLSLQAMVASNPGYNEEKIKQLKELTSPPSRSGCLVFFLVLLFGMAGIIAVFVVFSISFIR